MIVGKETLIPLQNASRKFGDGTLSHFAKEGMILVLDGTRGNHYTRQRGRISVRNWHALLTPTVQSIEPPQVESSHNNAQTHENISQVQLSNPLLHPVKVRNLSMHLFKLH